MVFRPERDAATCMEETTVSDITSPAESALPVITASTGFLKGQDKKHGASTRMYRAVASELVPGGLNVRMWAARDKIEKVVAMARSIYQNCEFEGDPLTDGRLVKSGVLDPVKAVNTNQLPAPLDAGETRWRGVRLLEGFDVLTNAPAEMGKGVLDGVNYPLPIPAVRPDLIKFDVLWINEKVSLTDRRFGVALSNQQTPFTDLEWAAYFDVLFKGNEATGEKAVPQREIADKLGVEESWVTWINKLNKLPAQLITLLERGQISTTTAIEAFDDYGAEGSVEHIMGEIEAGKGRAAVEHESALEEARAAQAELDAVIASGAGNEAVSSSPRSTTKFEAAQRKVQTATGKIERAKRQMTHGPDRITGRQVKERAAGKSSDRQATAGKTNGKINRTVFAAMHDAVIYAAKHSQEPFIRNEMLAALQRAGYPEVNYEGRDKEQPPLATLVATGPEIIMPDSVPETAEPTEPDAGQAAA